VTRIPPGVILATGNRGKAVELGAMLSPLPVAGSLADFSWIAAPEETGETLEENALLKGREIARHFPGHAVLSDDTGLEVDALGGAPGVRSARYAGESATYADNCAKLLREMAGVPPAKRTARFRCVLCWIEGGREFLFEGVCAGTIALSPRGAGGFGYDPVFVPEGSARSFAEMDEAGKNSLSHRGAALRKLLAHLGGRDRSQDFSHTQN
jgi:XTP/dITP diphosphohydrolase